MGILTDMGDRISPSLLDVRVLLALSLEEMNGYQITRQVEKDGGQNVTVSNGASQASVKRLILTGLIKKLPSDDYQITDFGRGILALQIKRLEQIVHLAKERQG